MPDAYSNPRYTILLKEIDLIAENIKNLDDVIYKTKNFAVVLWGGSLYLIAQHVEADKEYLLIYLTALIPFFFWFIHYRWQLYLSMCSARERMISWFINSPGFPLWLQNDENVHFPVYDVPGWLYTKQADKSHWERLGVKVDEAFLLDHRELTFWKIAFYKDAKWYYLLMIATSILYGFFG